MAIPGDISGCHNPGGGGGERTTGISWERARDAAKHPATHRTVPTTKNSPAKRFTAPRPRPLTEEAASRARICVDRPGVGQGDSPEEKTQPGSFAESIWRQKVSQDF